MYCSKSSLIFAVFAIVLFIVLFSKYGTTESFNKRWPTSYYDQGDWFVKNQQTNLFRNVDQKRSPYKKYNLAMWDL